MKIQENEMIVIKAVGPLLIVIVLFMIVGQFGFGKISELRAKISSAQKDQLTLTQKLDILRSVAGTGVQSSNLAVAALPDSNPALSVVSQIQILAGANGLALSELKSGTPILGSTGLSGVSVTFNVAGSRAQIESFIGAISSFAPITIVDKIKLSESSPGIALANISVRSFWAPFPTKVPAITQPITNLTPDEEQTLQSSSSLTQPMVSQVQPAPGGRSDPFNP